MLTLLNTLSVSQLRLAQQIPELSNLITQEMFDKVVDKGYPRSTGFAKVFDGIEIAEDESLDPYLEVLDLIYNDNEFEEVIKEYNLPVIEGTRADKFSFYKELLINKLIELTQDLYFEDLVKGDVVAIDLGSDIFRRHLVLAFDGYNFVDFENTDQFRSIERNIPLNYWENPLDDLYDVYVDIRPFRAELITGIHKDRYDRFYQSQFKANNKIYTITFEHQDDKDDLEDIKKQILKTDIINVVFGNDENNSMTWMMGY